MNTNICYIFVYGTLVKNGRNHHLMQKAEYMGDFLLKNYCMYSIRGSFPAIIPSEGEEVLGEVYSIGSDTLGRLDVLEGDIYDRSEVEVTDIDSGRSLATLTYVFNQSVDRYEKIEENIWPMKAVRVMGYGSLMSSKDLLRMYPSNEKKQIHLIGNGILEGHKLGYTYKSIGRKGGVLDVIKGNESDCVIGVVNEMPYKLMVDKIDERENNGKLYKRELVIVKINGRPTAVFCYFLLENKRDYRGVAPHSEYDNIVLTGMRENNFPDEYILNYLDYVRQLKEASWVEQ